MRGVEAEPLRAQFCAISSQSQQAGHVGAFSARIRCCKCNWGDVTYTTVEQWSTKHSRRGEFPCSEQPLSESLPPSFSALAWHRRPAQWAAVIWAAAAVAVVAAPCMPSVAVAAPCMSMGGGGGLSHSGMTAVRSSFSPGGYAPHDMGRMRMGDHGHDRGRHDRDHDHFRFFPTFAFGVDTYSDVYDPTYSGCLELRRIQTHAGWRWRRVWVCD
jgi:hypothetical protein